MSPQEAAATNFVKTYCRLCEAQCGLRLEVSEQQIVKVHPDREHPTSEGHLCIKAAGMAAITHDKDRVLTPLKKGPSGDFEIVSWDVALSEISDRLGKILDVHGGDALGVYGGNPISFATLHYAYLSIFLQTLGGSKMFNALHVDTGAKNLALELIYGSSLHFTFPDIEHCDFLMIIGANPVVSHMSLIAEPRALDRLKKIHAREGVVVVDPRKTETAKRFEHVPVQPDSDVWLLSAMLNHIFENNLHDTKIIERCDGLEELRAAVLPVTPQIAAAYCSVPAADICKLAERFANAKTGACYGRVGTNRGRYSTLTNIFIEALNIVTGQFGRQGGWVIGISPLANPDVPEEHPPAYASQSSRIGDFPLIMGATPGGTLQHEIMTPGPGQLKALFIDSGNPVRSYPDGEGLSTALKQLDLLVGLDLYVNETNRYADYILPVCGFYERPDLTDLWVTNAPRPWLQYTDAVIEPIGESRIEYDIYNDILQRMQKPTLFADLASESNPRPDLTTVADTLLRAGIYGDKFGANPDGLSIDKMRSEFSSGKRLAESVDAQASWQRITNESQRPQLWGDLADAEMQRLLQDQPLKSNGTLRLFGRRKLGSLNSWMHNIDRLTRSGRPTLMVNSIDAKARDISNGQIVALSSESGRIEVEVEVSDDVIVGSVNYPHGWGHNGSWQHANSLAGADINQLASSQPEDWEQVSGMVHLDGIEVRVSVLEEV